MSHTSSAVSVFQPTNELIQILGTPPLVGSEKLEDYEKFFALVASAIKPPDTVGWLFTKDVVDWSWEIRRDWILKGEIIKYHTKEVVGELIKSELAPSGQFETAHYRIFKAGAELESWSSNEQARKEIDAKLATKGYDAAYVLKEAYVLCSDQIDAIDKRIVFHGQCRNAALKEVGLWSDRLQRQLEQATSEVIDGEFAEAAE
jgi:hypothetical protein